MATFRDLARMGGRPMAPAGGAGRGSMGGMGGKQPMGGGGPSADLLARRAANPQMTDAQYYATPEGAAEQSDLAGYRQQFDQQYGTRETNPAWVGGAGAADSGPYAATGGVRVPGYEYGLGASFAAGQGAQSQPGFGQGNMYGPNGQPFNTGGNYQSNPNTPTMPRTDGGLGFGQVGAFMGGNSGSLPPGMAAPNGFAAPQLAQQGAQGNTQTGADQNYSLLPPGYGYSGYGSGRG